MPGSWWRRCRRRAPPPRRWAPSGSGWTLAGPRGPSVSETHGQHDQDHLADEGEVDGLAGAGQAAPENSTVTITSASRTMLIAALEPHGHVVRQVHPPGRRGLLAVVVELDGQVGEQAPAPPPAATAAQRRSVQANGTPRRKPKNSGGSPSGVSRPPTLLTAKMKKTTVCLACVRSVLARSSGRMSTMEAPMVPMKLASTAPTARKVRLCRGVATRLPVR